MKLFEYSTVIGTTGAGFVHLHYKLCLCKYIDPHCGCLFGPTRHMANLVLRQMRQVSPFFLTWLLPEGTLHINFHQAGLVGRCVFDQVKLCICRLTALQFIREVCPPNLRWQAQRRRVTALVSAGGRAYKGLNNWNVVAGYLNTISIHDSRSIPVVILPLLAYTFLAHAWSLEH